MTDDGAVFTVAVKNPWGTVVSGEAILTVTTVGDGLREDRFPNADFTGVPTTSIVPDIDESGVNGTVSIRWTGFLVPSVTGYHSLYVRATGPVRLWINGVLAINGLRVQTDTLLKCSMNLTAGQRYSIRMEFANRGTTPGAVQLLWSLPGQGAIPGGPGGTRGIVPASVFYSQ